MKLYIVITAIFILTFVSCNKDGDSTTAPETTTYTITPTAGNNGTITPSSPVKVNSGDNQRFIFTPAVGYVVDSVLVDGIKIDSTAGYTFINIKANHTIRVTFKLAAFIITPSSGPNGTISPSVPTYVASGQSQRFIFIPNNNYQVDSVLVDGLKIDSTAGYTFINIKANHTIRVTFKLASFIITPSNGPNGTISPSVPTYVTSGQSQRFIFIPDNNYQVDSVFVNGVEVDSLSGYTFLNVTANNTIRVVYSPVVAETWVYPSDGTKFSSTMYSSVTTVQKGSRFEVLLVYYNLTNVFGTAVELNFPTDKIAIRSIVAGPYISGSSALILKKLDSNAGRISFGATFTANSGNTANGSGVIFKLKCRAKNTGSCPFTINTTKLQILQSDGSSIPNFNSVQIENVTLDIQ